MKSKTKFKQTEIGKIKTFNDLVIYLYKTFPNGELSEDKVREIIVAKHIRDSLVENSFLIRESLFTNKKGKYYYSLGPNLLALVSSRKNEELAEKIRKLTYWIMGLTIVNVVLVLVQTLKIFGVFG